MSDLLLVFVKWPEPGFAKTRLIPALGPEAAAAVSRLLAEAAIAATRPRAGEYERLLCFAPASAEAQMRRWFPGESIWPQPDGDLGHRMAAAFHEGFARGATRVALVGTDIPWITADLVARSFEGLESADLVLGPAHDGGYYLVALSRAQPELFAGIEWSTPEVLAATRARADGSRPSHPATRGAGGRRRVRRPLGRLGPPRPRPRRRAGSTGSRPPGPRRAALDPLRSTIGP